MSTKSGQGVYQGDMVKELSSLFGVESHALYSVSTVFPEVKVKLLSKTFKLRLLCTIVVSCTVSQRAFLDEGLPSKACTPCLPKINSSRAGQSVFQYIHVAEDHGSL